MPAAQSAAVLVPLFEEDGDVRMILTRRSSHLPSHQGEVAFPGGKVHSGEALQDAALREAHEEVAIEPGDVEVIGTLEELATVVGRFVLSPFVGVLRQRSELVPNPGEVARVFDVSIAELLDPDAYHEELWDIPGLRGRPMHFFEVADETVWGATARILFEFLTLLTT
jgi:8-oxo-dGTP pyrophosphatase MutT (NUDIX family)